MVTTLLALERGPKVPAGPFGRARRHGRVGPSALLRGGPTGSNGTKRDGRAVANHQHGVPMQRTFNTFAEPLAGP